MLKILTNLTDEEMARMKYVRRVKWHMSPKTKHANTVDSISDQELRDRGIDYHEGEHVEYIKRPPHDKYL